MRSMTSARLEDEFTVSTAMITSFDRCEILQKITSEQFYE